MHTRIGARSQAEAGAKPPKLIKVILKMTAENKGSECIHGVTLKCFCGLINKQERKQVFDVQLCHRSQSEARILNQVL